MKKHEECRSGRVRDVVCICAGTISWLSGCALWGTSLAWVRRNYFEVGMRLPMSFLMRMHHAGVCTEGISRKEANVRS